MTRVLDALLQEVVRVEGRSFPVRAPAKINLRLRVLGRYSNGYHALSMVNGSISLADELVISFARAGGISLTVSPVISETPPEKNLAHVAVEQFLREFLPYDEWQGDGAPFGVKIQLEKKIPIGGGLGGGSSDAAAVLRILATTFGSAIQAALKLPEGEFLQRVHTVANRCGADVPYALRGGFAWVTGVGETVSPLEGGALGGGRVLVVFPNFQSNTAAFYDAFRVHYPELVNQSDEFEAMLQAGKMPSTGELLHNDFEPLLRKLYPEFNEYLSVLRRYTGGRGGITGSGATLFAPLADGSHGAIESLNSEVNRLGGSMACVHWLP